MRKLVFIAMMCGAVPGVPAAGQIPPGFAVVHISDSPLDEFRPRMNNRGQVVFTRWVAGNRLTEEIFLYDNGELIQITNDNVQDASADIADDGTIVWSRGLGPPCPNGEPTLEVVMYRNGELTRLTDNAVEDIGPRINNRGEVVWKRYTGIGCGLTTDIFLYDGTKVVPITTNSVSDRLANQQVVINDFGQIAWTRYDYCVTPWESSIMLFDRGQISTISPPDAVVPVDPSIDNLTRVAWTVGVDARTLGIDIWEAGVVTRFRPGAVSARLNERGDVAFTMLDPATRVAYGWLFRDGVFYRLDTEPNWTASDINSRGSVVWRFGSFPNADVRLLLRLPAGDLNCDGALNGADLEPFFQALGNPADYVNAFPGCDRTLADMNEDGAVNGADIDKFFAALGGG